MSRVVQYIFLAAVFLGGAGCDEVSVSEQNTGQTLCFSYFVSCVNPILDKDLAGGLSCSSPGASCHNVDTGGVGGTFKVHRFAVAGADLEDNFFASQAQANINTPADSLLLRKPVANSDVNHGGGDLFLTTSDPDYQQILYWLSYPVDDPDPVDANENPACANLYVNGDRCQIF